jgi:uncharacterized membrane protein
VEYDGGRVTVVDLDSTNGTYLGDSRLLPRITEVWTPDRPLRVGGAVVYLEMDPGLLPATDETVARVASPPDAELRIGVSAETFDLAVDPGSSVTAAFKILNQGSVVDHFETSVEGVPAEWVAERPPVIRLLPGEEHEIAVSILPPRSPQSRAGRYPVSVCIASQDAPHQVARVRGTLTVRAYYQFDLELRPQKGTGISKGDYGLRLDNQGNANLTVELEAVDSEDGCRYAFDPPQAVVPPGQDRVVPLQVRPKAPLPGGVERGYLFTVTARPTEAPEQVRTAQGQWVQIAPAYQASLRPQRQSGTEKGVFQVRIANQSVADLDVQLEAADPEDACTYAFESSQLSVPAGQERAAQLELRPLIPLPGEVARTYSFVVTARPVGAPGSARQIQGQWVHIPPSFEVSVHPAEASGTDVGTYSVQISNQGIADVEVQLEAADAAGACTYRFERSAIVVPASQDRVVQLEVRPRQVLRGKESHSHPFTITARASAAPRSVRQAQAEWVQLPRVADLWGPALMTFAGWIVGWALFWSLGRGFYIEGFVEELKDVIGHDQYFLAFLIVWAFRGAAAGLIGGAATGLALRWAEPAFGWRRVLGVTLCWSLVWAIGVASAPLTGIPFEEELIAIVFWAVVGAIAGAVGGVITGMALRGAVPSLGGEWVLVIAMGWAAAWAVGQFAVEWAVHAGDEWMWRMGSVMVEVVLGFILGGLGGVIGAIATFAALSQSHRQPQR